MSEFSTELKLFVARKEHNCIAYEIIIDSGCRESDFEPQEWLRIQEMKDKNGKIQKGEEYFFWSGFFDGQAFSSRANKEMHEIVSKNEWWDS